MTAIERTPIGEPTVIEAPAKLTLSLAVTGTRDDGYHLIDAEMVSLDLTDIVTITPHGTTPTTARQTEPAGSTTTSRSSGADSSGDDSHSAIEVTGPYAAGVPTDGSNLVGKALELCGRKANIIIDKRIPHGGGLGGGSTDAAAVLRWADYRDLDAASSIGADIPFCMVGGRARVTGIGELIAPLPYLDSAFTLIIPPLAVSTPAAYAAFDQLDPNLIAAASPNQLEPAAIAVVPALADWRDEISVLAGQQAVLAGSGATWFVNGRHGNALAGLSNEGAQIIEVKTTPAF